MIILYGNKPLVSRRLALFFVEKFPNQKLVYIHSMYFTNVSFDYPKNIKWKDFPYITTPQFKISDIKNWQAKTLIDGTLEDIDIDFNDIRNSDKIIYVADPGSTDTYLFSQFIQKMFNKEVNEIDIDAMSLYSLSDTEILKSINNMSNFSETFENVINQGRIKKYFDYNFNFNSFALLGRVYQQVNSNCGDDKNLQNDFGSIFISKNMLQLLYFIKTNQANHINDTVGKLITKMNYWKGTGKYDFRASIGNPASYYPIIENLLILKLIDYKEKEIFITEKGQKFLQSLPKDCMDYDLPFRIELWSQQPFNESKIKIDNYLSNYYKKVKNKLKALDNRLN